MSFKLRFAHAVLLLMTLAPLADFEKANEIFFRLGIIYKQQRKSAQSLEVRAPFNRDKRVRILTRALFTVLPLHPQQSATSAHRDRHLVPDRPCL